MVNQRWNVNPRFVICEDTGAVSAITSGMYPTGSIMYRQDTQHFYYWNGSAWTELALVPSTGITESMLSTSMLELIRGPVRGKKVGGFTATNLQSGWGIMAGNLTVLGSAGAVGVDVVYGSNVRRNTGAVSGNNCGFSYPNPLTMRKFNPILGIRTKPSAVALNRMYMGWKSNATSPAALTDDPLANLFGVMFLQRSGDTTWQICSNNNSASSTIVDTTTPISSTDPDNLLIRGDDANSKWQWSTNLGATWTDVTGNFPENQAMYYVQELQTAEDVIHGLYNYAVEVVSDK